MMFSASHLRPSQANHVPMTPLDMLDRTVAEQPDALAVIWGEQRITWAEFDAMVQRFAGRLRDLGVGKSDVVSVIAGNIPEMLAAHFAVPTLGAVLNAINTRLDPETVQFIVRHCEAKVLITDAPRADLGRASDTLPVHVFGQDFDIASGPLPERIDWRGVVTDDWQPIALNYTSGTTGNPKGVVLHHRGAYMNALGNADALGFDRDTVYLWTLPLFHCNGWCHGWAVTSAGGTHVCLDGVDPSQVYSAIEDHGVTNFFCAPVVLYMLLDHPDRVKRSAASRPVKVGTGGAAPTSSLIERMDALAFDLSHLYGLTECYGPATVNHLPQNLREAEAGVRAKYLASQGKRHKTACVLKVFDVADQEVPQDGETTGEIVLRGNTLMAGYLKNPDATAEALRDGWFRTGDLAVVLPDGRLMIKDRAKDIIITGGENVSSIEVEDVLHRCEAVALAAVVAAPHEKWGETPCAFIELRDGGTIEEVEAHCREHLAGFKRPRYFVPRAIPKTATGKVQKFILRQEAKELFGGGDL